MPGDVTAPSPCHWWRHFRASGAARWQRGCWTAWRRAAQWNQEQTAAKGANQNMERPSDAPGAASFTACDAVGHPVLAGSVRPPFLHKRRNTQQNRWDSTLRTDVCQQSICSNLSDQGGKRYKQGQQTCLQHYNQLGFHLEWPTEWARCCNCWKH